MPRTMVQASTINFYTHEAQTMISFVEQCQTPAWYKPKSTAMTQNHVHLHNDRQPLSNTFLTNFYIFKGSPGRNSLYMSHWIENPKL